VTCISGIRQTLANARPQGDWDVEIESPAAALFDDDVGCLSASHELSIPFLSSAASKSKLTGRSPYTVGPRHLLGLHPQNWCSERSFVGCVITITRQM
jgi:hypothetical protein